MAFDNPFARKDANAVRVFDVQAHFTAKPGAERSSWTAAKAPLMRVGEALSELTGHPPEQLFAGELRTGEVALFHLPGPGCRERAVAFMSGIGANDLNDALIAYERARAFSPEIA